MKIMHRAKLQQDYNEIRKWIPVSWLIEPWIPYRGPEPRSPQRGKRWDVALQQLGLWNKDLLKLTD